jgi:hypothetical protein
VLADQARQAVGDAPLGAAGLQAGAQHLERAGAEGLVVDDVAGWARPLARVTITALAIGDCLISRWEIGV